jgi:hypothetical protein
VLGVEVGVARLRLHAHSTGDPPQREGSHAFGAGELPGRVRISRRVASWPSCRRSRRRVGGGRPFHATGLLTSGAEEPSGCFSERRRPFRTLFGSSRRAGTCQGGTESFLRRDAGAMTWPSSRQDQPVPSRSGRRGGQGATLDRPPLCNSSVGESPGPLPSGGYPPAPDACAVQPGRASPPPPGPSSARSSSGGERRCWEVSSTHEQRPQRTVASRWRSDLACTGLE